MILLAIAFSANRFHLYAQTSNQENSISQISCDWFYSTDELLFQDIYFLSQDTNNLNLNLRLYKLNTQGDSTIIFSISGKSFEVRKGANKLNIPFKDRRIKFNIKEDWLKAYKSIGRVPVGSYSCYVELENNASLQKFTERILLESDTLITEYNKFSSGISKILGNNSIKVSKALNNKSALLERYYKKKNITCIKRIEDEKVILDLYHGLWFLGRKELPADVSTS